MAVWYSVLYEVTWHEGRRGTGVCQYWTTVDGRNKLFASNLGNRSQPLRGQIYVLRPSQVHDTGAPWATLVVAGKARGRVTRVRRVDGGYTSGCGSPPPAFVPPPNDCRTAGLPSPTAGLLAGWAALPTPITLDYTKRDSSVDPDPEVVPLTRPVIFLSVGARPPFSRCPLPLEAPEHPSNFALRVTNAEWSKLRTLRFGRDVPRAQRDLPHRRVQRPLHPDRAGGGVLLQGQVGGDDQADVAVARSRLGAGGPSAAPDSLAPACTCGASSCAASSRSPTRSR